MTANDSKRTFKNNNLFRMNNNNLIIVSMVLAILISGCVSKEDEPTKTSLTPIQNASVDGCYIENYT